MFYDLIMGSDVRASVLYHLTKNPEMLESFLDLKGKDADLVQKFRRLEGRVEKMYTQSEIKTLKSESAKEAAQASSDKTDKDRTHPAEAQAGRNSSARDVPKPRPSSEVAARGGSAPPDEPAIGSRAWMERENAKYSSKTTY